jgi:hypothetical protein
MADMGMGGMAGMNMTGVEWHEGKRPACDVKERHHTGWHEGHGRYKYGQLKYAFHASYEQRQVPWRRSGEHGRHGHERCE